MFELRDEPQAERLERAIVADLIRLIPATCVLEARMVLASRHGEHALAEIDLWLAKIASEIIPIDADLVDLATQAWFTYGKGRHPASLNFAVASPMRLPSALTMPCSSSAKISNEQGSRRHNVRVRNL